MKYLLLALPFLLGACAAGAGDGGRPATEPAGSGGARAGGAMAPASGGQGAGGAVTIAGTGGTGTGGTTGTGGASTAEVGPMIPSDAGSSAPSEDARKSDTAAQVPEAGGGGSPPVAGAVTWAIDNTKSIGGHAATVFGAPAVIDTPGGKALSFDGVDDAIFLDHHPLAGLGAFTVEVIFRPDPGGSGAQRFFHMQEGTAANGARVLFETRLPNKDSFVLDVFVESSAGEVALYTPKFTHPLGAWYNVAAVIDGKRMRHYVNGVEESNVELGFTPHKAGRTSIGVRITKMYYFKGAIRAARFTPRVLSPAEFMQPN